jgi:hypothetical protein
MDDPSQDAAAFIRKLTEMAYRLAVRHIVVSSLHAHWSHFGSWELQTQREAEAVRYADAILSQDPTRTPGPEVVRVFWDGRDGILSIEASPTRFCSAPNEWKEECSKGFDLMDDELIQFVEDYLVKRLGV